MEFQSYNQELAVANLLFMNIFKNIRIGRTDDRGQETQIVVPCLLGQRSRVLKGLENPDKRGNYKLPMIVINRTGYSRSGDRLNNLHNEVKYELGPAYRKYHLMAPVPIDISYDVTLIAKYPADIDKIASNFMVFFNSDIYVSCEHPKYQGVKMNNQVIMQDSVSEDHPDEPDPSSDDLTTATFQFTFKTFLFAGTEQCKLIKSKQTKVELSTAMSSIVTEILPDQIDQFQKEHPDKEVSAVICISPDKIDQFQKDYPQQPVSAMVDQTVTVEVSSEVETSSSVDVYDGIPLIEKIDFGFYVVPNKHEILPYIQSVDNGDFGEHAHADICSYISSDNYYSLPPATMMDPYGDQVSSFQSPLSGDPDHDEVVDLCCSLAPYVDKIYWTIDTTSPFTWPNNMKAERCSRQQ